MFVWSWWISASSNSNQSSTNVTIIKDPKLTSICSKVSYLKIVEFETDSYNGFCSPSKLWTSLGSQEKAYFWIMLSLVSSLRFDTCSTPPPGAACAQRLELKRQFQKLLWKLGFLNFFKFHKKEAFSFLMKGFLIHTGIFQWLITELETAFEEYDKDWSNVRFWSVKESLLHAHIALCKAKA